jgi:type VI secretion system secreted protein VgrG
MDQPSNNLYTQTFDVSSVVANRATGTVLDGKPYRIYLPDGTLHQQGMLTDGATVPVRTGQSVNVKCEIGDGDWSAIEDAYDHDDIAHDNA